MHFNFIERLEEAFICTHKGFAKINLTPEQFLRHNKKSYDDCIKQIENFKDFYQSCRDIFKNNQHTQSFYNYGGAVKDGKNLYYG
jgi:hypothetical protein